VLEGLACVAARRAATAQDAVLLGAAQSLRSRTGTPLPAQDEADVEQRPTRPLVSLARRPHRADEQGRE